MNWLRRWLGMDGPRGTRPEKRRRLALERLEARDQPATLTWNYSGFGYGDWNAASCWTPDAGTAHVPTVNDNVVFNGTGTGNCATAGNIECKTLTITTAHASNFDLGGMTLKIDNGGSGDSTLAGGQVINGTLEAYRGHLYVTGGNHEANITVGPDNANTTATLYVSASILPMTPSNIIVRQGGTAQVTGSVTLGTKIDVKSGGAFYFTQNASTVEIANGGVITVRDGGLLNLATATINATGTGTYISNYGTVEKTDTGTSTLQMGMKNQASTSVLRLNGGTNSAFSTLKFTDALFGDTSTLVQADGKIQLSFRCELHDAYGYKQNGGTFSVMARASNSSWAYFNAEGGENLYSAEINGGSVVLSDGTSASTHDSVLNSNMWFKFSATSSLKFGINPDRDSVDLLEVEQLTLFSGAKAILDTSNLDPDFVPEGAWQFVTAEAGITGSFTLDCGTLLYTISKNNQDHTYQLNT